MDLGIPLKGVLKIAPLRGCALMSQAHGAQERPDSFYLAKNNRYQTASE